MSHQSTTWIKYIPVYIFVKHPTNPFSFIFSLFETSQSLFWASFGLVDLTAFDLTGIKSFTRFWAMLIFGCYSVINIIVLLNMLIAMMSNSYQIISVSSSLGRQGKVRHSVDSVNHPLSRFVLQERADVEWKFARSKLFISYFEEGDELPPPFNLFPDMRTIRNMFKLGNSKMTGSMIVSIDSIERFRDFWYLSVIRSDYVLGAITYSHQWLGDHWILTHTR